MQSQLAFRYQWWVFRCHDAVIGRREAVNYICFFDSYVTHQIWVDVWLAIRSWRRPRKAPQEQKIHSERAELQEEDKEYKVWNPSTSRPVPVQSQALDIPSSVTEVGRRYKVARPLDIWSGEHFGSIWWSATSMPTAVCHCSAGIVRNCHFCCWFLIYASNGTSQEFGWHAPRSSSSWQGLATWHWRRWNSRNMFQRCARDETVCARWNTFITCTRLISIFSQYFFFRRCFLVVLRPRRLLFLLLHHYPLRPIFPCQIKPYLWKFSVSAPPVKHSCMATAQGWHALQSRQFHFHVTTCEITCECIQALRSK